MALMMHTRLVEWLDIIRHFVPDYATPLIDELIKTTRNGVNREGGHIKAELVVPVEYWVPKLSADKMIPHAVFVEKLETLRHVQPQYLSAYISALITLTEHGVEARK